jgi:hypothetical protein
MSPVRKKLYAVIIIVVFCFIIVGGIGNYRAEQLATEIAAVRLTKRWPLRNGGWTGAAAANESDHG